MGDTTGEEGEDDEESAAYPPGYDKWVTRGEVEKKAMVPNGKNMAWQPQEARG